MNRVWAPIIVSTLLLLLGVLDDLRSRKVHNELVLTGAALAIASMWYMGGWPCVLEGLGGLLVIATLCLPLVLLRVIGAGDMKLLMAVGLTVPWVAAYQILIFAIIWGGVFGLTRVLIQGDGRLMLKNLLNLVRLKKPTAANLHQIPFTVALLLGWLSYLRYDGVL